jgi:hypothetical protein
MDLKRGGVSSLRIPDWPKHVPYTLDVLSLKTVLVPGDVKYCEMDWDSADCVPVSWTPQGPEIREVRC